MVKAKKGKNKKAAAPVGPTTNSTSSTTTPSMTATAVTTTTATATATATSPDHPMMETTATVTAASSSLMTTSHPVTTSSSRAAAATITAEDLDDLTWLRDIEMRQASNGEPLLKLEYNDNDDECMSLLQRFLEESSADSEIIDAIYQIWQQTVLSTLLQSSATWKKETVTQRDQKTMKDSLRVARLKINFILHHLIGRILTSPLKKWVAIRDRVMDMCYNTLQLMPRLVESCQHHPTDIRLAIVHYEGKEFLAAVACETWDTLYDYSIRMDPQRFVPVLRRCAMLDILDKDWNMLGGWDDVLKGLETKCCQHLTNNNNHNGSNHHHHHYNNNNNITTSNSNSSSYPSTPYTIPRLPSDYILHETTTILRNARNSMQCKFFSVRFMRYTDDQAPQRYRYYPKCSAPACANIETSHQIHPYRCTKCWYFHYCSASCQEYCDNIMGLHAKFCNDTPKAKAASCQKETEQYLGWSLSSISSSSRTNPNDLHDLTVVRCHTCGVPDDHHGTTTTTTTSTWHTTVKMKRCVQCQRVSYCSRACQEWDWRVGGHCHVCRPITTTTTVTNNNTLLLNNNNNKSSGSGTNNHTTTTTTTTSMAKDLN